MIEAAFLASHFSARARERFGDLRRGLDRAMGRMGHAIELGFEAREVMDRAPLAALCESGEEALHRQAAEREVRLHLGRFVPRGEDVTSGQCRSAQQAVATIEQDLNPIWP